MDAEKVMTRYLEKTGLELDSDTRVGFKYSPKESKKSKVERVMRLIRDKTGIGRKVAEDIANAIVRGRDVVRLTFQKKWPMVEGVIEGPRGTLPLEEAQATL